MNESQEKGILPRIAVLLEAIKFAHSIFALPFALFACFLAADDWPAASKVVLIVVCMVCVRSLAMCYNRLVDQSLDKHNPRTADWALPAGALTRRFVWVFAALAALAAAIAAYAFKHFFNNSYPIALLIPLIIYVCAYSHAKRFTWLCHFWLGSVLGLSVLATFVAIDPSQIGIGAVLLTLAVALWTAGFDIIYSMQDIDFDRRRGLCSIPARFGIRSGLWVARSLHLAAFACFALAGPCSGLTWIYLCGVIVAGSLLIYQHRLIRADDLSRVNVAFFTVNGFLSIFLSATGILDVIL